MFLCVLVLVLTLQSLIQDLEISVNSAYLCIFFHCRPNRSMILKYTEQICHVFFVEVQWRMHKREMCHQAVKGQYFIKPLKKPLVSILQGN